jgi:hypothetical protein
MLTRALKDHVQRNPLTRELLRIFRTRQVILLEFPVHSRPRWGHGQPPHPELYELLAQHREAYAGWLQRLLELRSALRAIPRHTARDASEPTWVNGYLPALDATALYGLLTFANPQRYFEIGSGHSTKFARRTIRDQQLRTRITSVDPQPRAQIDALADVVVRQPLESLNLSQLADLEAGDILFFDGSHRCFMNSDVTVFFLEVLPRLRSGVRVHIHDVTLPYDYPPDYVPRYYSEQYLLAASLLSRGTRFDVLLPNFFIQQDGTLSTILSPLWQDLQLPGGGGCSFWMEIR